MKPSAWYVVYVRPGTKEPTRLGPMAENYARAMTAEYSRRGLEPTLEEWQPVNEWRHPRD